MKTLLILAVLTALLLLYAVWGREWLKSKAWAQGFFAFVEPIEIALFKKSETILFARLKIAAGLLLTLLTQLGTIDLTPLMPFVPDQYEGIVRTAFNMLPLVITAIGWMDESLRNKTTKPLELVAIPEAKITPELAETIAVADDAKAMAVAAVAEAKVA